jgi:hypothetical protein
MTEGVQNEYIRNPSILLNWTDICKADMTELGEMLAKQGGKKWSTLVKQRN